jgi:hypothetical protein
MIEELAEELDLTIADRVDQAVTKAVQPLLEKIASLEGQLERLKNTPRVEITVPQGPAPVFQVPSAPAPIVKMERPNVIVEAAKVNLPEMKPTINIEAPVQKSHGSRKWKIVRDSDDRMVGVEEIG